jgi:hypothetical protein
MHVGVARGQVGDGISANDGTLKGAGHGLGGQEGDRVAAREQGVVNNEGGKVTCESKS